MSHRISCFVAFGLLTVPVSMAPANGVPAPVRPQQPRQTAVKAPLVVQRTSGRPQTVIVIPRKFVAPGGKAVPGEGERPGFELQPKSGPGEGAAPPKTSALDALSRHRTTIAGIAMMLAACSFVLIARRKSRGTTATGLILLGVSCFGAGAALADIAPPPEPPKTQIEIRYVDSGDSVTLIPGTRFPAIRR